MQTNRIISCFHVVAANANAVDAVVDATHLHANRLLYCRACRTLLDLCVPMRM